MFHFFVYNRFTALSITSIFVNLDFLSIISLHVGFLFISVYTDFQMFGLEMDGGVSGGEGYKLSETTLQQGGLWYMVHSDPRQGSRI